MIYKFTLNHRRAKSLARSAAYLNLIKGELDLLLRYLIEMLVILVGDQNHIPNTSEALLAARLDTIDHIADVVAKTTPPKPLRELHKMSVEAAAKAKVAVQACRAADVNKSAEALREMQKSIAAWAATAQGE